MRPFATLDLESDPFLYLHIPTAFAGCLYVPGKGYLVLEGSDCCARLVRACIEEGKKQNGLLIYAHNGGKFDFHFLLEELLTIYDESEIDLVCIGPRMVEIRTPHVTFRDSFSLVPKKLSAFSDKKEISIWKLAPSVKFLVSKRDSGEYVFAEHKEELIKEGWINEDFRPIRADIPRSVYRDEIIAYLKQDCRGLSDALAEFFEKYGCELTLASTSFKVLKKQFNLKPVKTNIHYDSRFRPFYFSGRVQFFALGQQGSLDGKHRYSIADINSAFPAAMLQKHWFGSEYIELSKPPTKYRDQCFYEITCDSDGILPIRDDSGAIQFPTVKKGRFFATGWELFTGVDLGKVRNVRYHRIYRPLEVADFSSYVNHFYASKKDCDEKLKNETLTKEQRKQIEAQRDFDKLFLNAVYGKFGQDPRQFRDVKISRCGEVPEPKRVPVQNKRSGEEYETIEGKLYKLQQWEHSYDDQKRGLSFWQLPSHDDSSSIPLSFYNVCTAASITGCVRAFLARSIAQCRDVLYCDTDSIIAGDISKLTLGTELGQWKLEKKCDAIWIGGKKLYAAHGIDLKPKEKEWKTASKGVRLTVSDLRAVCEGEARSYSFDAPNYSVFSPMNFTSRTVRRDDKRKRKGIQPI